MLVAVWVGLGVAIGCAAVLIISAFWPGVQPSEQIGALTGVASASAAVAMFATLHFLRQQLFVLRQQTETLREQTDAVLKQTSLHAEELRYYYEPGVYVQVYSAVPQVGVSVRALAATHTNAFDIEVQWADSEGHAQEMILTGGGAPGSIPAGPNPRWQCPHLTPGQAAWAMLTWEGPEARLVVGWRHLTEYRWRQTWKLREVGKNRWDLVPEGPPEREPLRAYE